MIIMPASTDMVMIKIWKFTIIQRQTHGKIKIKMNVRLSNQTHNKNTVYVGPCRPWSTIWWLKFGYSIYDDDYYYSYHYYL